MPASILIADSSSAMRAVIQRAVRVAGLPVSDCYQAGRAQDVLRLYESHGIDFLLLDTHLAGTEAEELIGVLRARREHAVPFMVTSADASSARIERLLELGACDYLLKPFSVTTLCARLEQALEALHANN